MNEWHGMLMAHKSLSLTIYISQTYLLSKFFFFFDSPQNMKIVISQLDHHPHHKQSHLKSSMDIPTHRMVARAKLSIVSITEKSSGGHTCTRYYPICLIHSFMIAANTPCFQDKHVRRHG